MARKKSPLLSRPLYSVHPGVTMVQNWIATLPEKTGRSFDEWVRFIKESGPPDQKARREWLKNEHHLGTNTAWWLAEAADGTATWDGDPDTYLTAAPQYVEEMFAKKPALRPLYDKLLRLALDLGPDVKACPCKTIVPLYRNHVFPLSTIAGMSWAAVPAAGVADVARLDQGGEAAAEIAVVAASRLAG